VLPHFGTVNSTASLKNVDFLLVGIVVDNFRAVHSAASLKLGVIQICDVGLLPFPR
jgi:hypothetical protein